MLNFRKVTLEDKEQVEAYFAKSDFRGAEYNFSHLYLWSRVYPMEIAEYAGYITVYAKFDRETYLYPAGEGDIRPMIEAMEADAKVRGIPFIIRSVTPENVEYLKTLYPDKFTYHTSPDFNDYIYLTEKLGSLAGKKLHSKRNHINRFKENNPDWSYEKITDQNLPEVCEMSRKWCEINGCNDDDELKKEACAVRVALKNLEALDLRAGLLRAGGQVIAFSIGRRINSDTFGVHVEKAFYDIQGAYPMINQQFVQAEMEGFTYVNREEDTGDEGLRKAKQSYYPVMMVERYSAVAVEK